MILLSVLKKGQCLKNSEFWKKVQMFLVMIMGFLPIFPQIDPTLFGQINAGIGGIIIYLTAATSDKVGV